MKIYSEKTKKEYLTVDECLAAEEEFDKQAALEKEKKEKIAAERKERAAEVEEAFKAIQEAKKAYDKKLEAFIKDYGNFHLTIKTGEGNPFNLFNDFFNHYWF